MMRRNPASDLCVYAENASMICEYAESAIRSGLRSLVLSLPSSFSSDEFRALRAKYAEHILFLRAFEGERRVDEAGNCCDVLIGVPETLELGGVILPFPKTARDLLSAVRYTNGEMLTLWRACYSAMTALPQKTGCDAVRLLDFLSLNTNGALFDPRDKRYEQVAWRATEELLKQDVVIELCVSPCRGGVLPISNPDAALLRCIGEQSGRVALSSRATSPKGLCLDFRSALSQLRACGIGSIHVWQESGWACLPL